MPTEAPGSSRATQLARQACDPCRVRKVKCVTGVVDITTHLAAERAVPSADGGSDKKCQRCTKLGLVCSYLLPTGVRGPRRKEKPSTQKARRSRSPDMTSRNDRGPTTISVHRASDIRASVDSFVATPTLVMPSPAPADHSIQSPAVSNTWTNSPHSVGYHFLRHEYPTDRLCSRVLFRQMMTDYLGYLYPLIPVVHRPSFLDGVSSDRDLHDKDFLGLVLALCAATIGTMPSRFREYCSYDPPLPFRTRTEMINSCYNIITSLRGPGYFDEINYQKWAVYYLMQIAFFQIGEHNRARMIEVESMQLARLLDLHQISKYNGLNCIETQLRKKAFWLMFYGYVHGQLQNLRKERLCYLDETILNSINLDELIPLEVDDEYILEDQILLQPQGRVPLTSGFNVHSRVFWTALLSTSPRSDAHRHDHCNCVRSNRPDLQLQYLRERLHDLKFMLDNIPPYLRQWATNLASTSGFEAVRYDELPLLTSQFASMRANIHVTQLWLQSIISDKIEILLLDEGHLGTPMSASPGSPITCLHWADREDLCRQLLHMLHSIDASSIEPNGHHLTFKVRDVAVSLLACPADAGEGTAKRAKAYLDEFTSILGRIDGSETMNTLSLQSWVDTDRRPFGVLSGFGVR